MYIKTLRREIELFEARVKLAKEAYDMAHDKEKIIRSQMKVVSVRVVRRLRHAFDVRYDVELRSRELSSNIGSSCMSPMGQLCSTSYSYSYSKCTSCAGLRTRTEPRADVEALSAGHDGIQSSEEELPTL